MALPLTLIIILGEIDLSVESMAGLASATLGFMWAAGVPLEIGIPVVLVIGALGGLLNGTLVGSRRPAVARRHAGHARPLPGHGPDHPRPARRQQLPAGVHRARASATCPGRLIPWSFVVFLALALVLGIVLHRTWIGRQTYAIGKNAGHGPLLRSPGHPAPDRPVRPVGDRSRPWPASSSPRASRAPGPTPARA